MPFPAHHIVKTSSLLCLLIALVAVAGCTGPSKIDEECIKGRLSKEQAAEINKGPWGHLPLYNQDANGQCKDCAQETDRVLSAKCSNLVKRI